MEEVTLGKTRLGTLWKYVFPAILTNACIFLFTIIDGIFVGLGDKKGTNNTFMHSLTLTLLIAIIVTLIGTLGREPISKLLGANEHYLSMVKEYMLFWALFATPITTICLNIVLINNLGDAGVNTLISLYLYSTKRSGYEIIINVVRSFIINIVIIIGLTAIFGSSIIWFTFGISESLVLIISVVLVKLSERNGIVYK